MTAATPLHDTRLLVIRCALLPSRATRLLPAAPDTPALMSPLVGCTCGGMFVDAASAATESDHIYRSGDGWPLAARGHRRPVQAEGVCGDERGLAGALGQVGGGWHSRREDEAIDGHE